MNAYTFGLRTDSQMPPARQTLELLRDVLRIYANFVRETAEVEKEHDFDFTELQNLFGKTDSSTFFSSLSKLDPKVQVAFISTMGRIAVLAKETQNPLALKPADKLSLAEKLDATVYDLENAVGVSKVTSKPTDLDKQLVERCAKKDYHDTVTNAFALLEDKMRERIGEGRESYGEQLVNLCFNPDSGRLILGQTESERQGIYLLFRGAFSFLRNAPSHTLTIDEDRNAAPKVMHMVDLLMKLVEKASFRS